MAESDIEIRVCLGCWDSRNVDLARHKCKDPWCHCPCDKNPRQVHFDLDEFDEHHDNGGLGLTRSEADLL